MLKLPNARYPHQSTEDASTSDRVLLTLFLTVVPRLIHESQDENDLQADHTRAKPEDIRPVMRLVNNEVAEAGSKVRRGDIEHSQRPIFRARS